MVKKQDVKGVAIVFAGVFLAGVLMYQFRDIEIVANARAGFGG